MKTLAVSAFAVLAFVLPAAAQAPLRAGDVKIDKATPTMVRTPEFSLSSGPSKRSENREWLEVEVEFTTLPEMIDELTFNYKILMGGKLLVGEVTHVAIPKGKGHFSVAYVSPRSLEALNGGKPPGANAVQGLWVDAAKQGQVLAQFTTARGATPNVPQVQGFVLQKPNTPFAPLFWDRYEAIKQTR